jgi:hypothetical protein
VRESPRDSCTRLELIASLGKFFCAGERQDPFAFQVEDPKQSSPAATTRQLAQESSAGPSAPLREGELSVARQRKTKSRRHAFTRQKRRKKLLMNPLLIGGEKNATATPPAETREQAVKQRKKVRTRIPRSHQTFVLVIVLFFDCRLC